MTNDPVPVKCLAFVWTEHGGNVLRLTTEDGTQHNFSLRDKAVILLLDQMWQQRVVSLATEGSDT